MPEAFPDGRLTFGDQRAIPQAAILIREQDQVALEREPRAPARFDAPVLSAIAEAAAAAYPNEGCGALLGERSRDGASRVTRMVSVTWSAFQ